MTREEFLDRIDDIMCGTSITERAYLEDLYYEVIKPHWISVEDELPEENKWVLTYNGSSINLLMLAGNANWYDHSVAKHLNITHWMPLPAIEGIRGNQGKISPNEEGGEQ